MKKENKFISSLKICSLLLLVTATITNLTIESAKADGAADNDASEVIDLDQSSNNDFYQQPQQQSINRIEGGINRDFPEVFSSNSNSFPCYMETEDGKKLNLMEICGQESDQQ